MEPAFRRNDHRLHAYRRRRRRLSPRRRAICLGRRPRPGTPQVPLFMQAAVGAPVPAPWPSSGGAVTFHDEMLALRAALTVTPTQPPRAAAAPETSDTVEVVIRDRFGRPIRVERIDRRRLAGGGANPPPVQPRFYGSAPYAPYGYPYR
jgi:hypothetical protein